ncbi:hypothetical protein AQUCO_00800128v1, partial [Aquilegia coerulea]
DIIIEILSRLNIKSVYQCHYVCTRFHKMMSTPSFISMHLNQNRGKPIIVLCLSEYVRMHHQNPDVYKIPLLFIDEGNNQIWRTKVKFKLNYKPSLYPSLPDLIGSYNGLLLFKHENNDVLIIFNPITQEHVHVTFPSADYELCGFYFHTPTREYRILYMLQQLNKPCRYFVYSLKNKLLREISNHTEAPCTCLSPIILNGVLLWMAYVGDQRLCINRKPGDCSKSILVFKMDSEEFITMPHPGSQCQSNERHRVRMHLLEMEGQLCFCDISSPTGEGYDAEVYIWVLKDFTKQIWVRKYIVSLSHMSKFRNDFHWDPLVELLQIRNNELLLRKGQYNLFCYHLVLDTFRKVDMGSIVIMKSVVIHTNSLVSLQTSI